MDFVDVALLLVSSRWLAVGFLMLGFLALAIGRHRLAISLSIVSLATGLIAGVAATAYVIALDHAPQYLFYRGGELTPEIRSGLRAALAPAWIRRAELAFASAGAACVLALIVRRVDARKGPGLA
jgi:hypothetical protein